MATDLLEWAKQRCKGGRLHGSSVTHCSKSMKPPSCEPKDGSRGQVADLRTTSQLTAAPQALPKATSSLFLKLDDHEATQALVRPLLASYVLPLSRAIRLVRFYNSPAGLLLSLIEVSAVVMCHLELLSGRRWWGRAFFAFLVWPSLLMRLGILDRRAVFQLVRNFEWWFVFINYAVLALALAAMLAHDLARLHTVLAITTFTLPSLCADAGTLRRDRPAVGLALSGANVVFLGLASWRQWFQGAEYELPLFLGEAESEGTVRQPTTN